MASENLTCSFICGKRGGERGEEHRWLCEPVMVFFGKYSHQIDSHLINPIFFRALVPHLTCLFASGLGSEVCSFLDIVGVSRVGLICHTGNDTASDDHIWHRMIKFGITKFFRENKLKRQIHDVLNEHNIRGPPFKEEVRRHVLSAKLIQSSNIKK